MPEANAPAMGSTAIKKPQTAAVTRGTSRLGFNILHNPAGTKATHRKNAMIVT